MGICSFALIHLITAGVWIVRGLENRVKVIQDEQPNASILVIANRLLFPPENLKSKIEKKEKEWQNQLGNEQSKQFTEGEELHFLIRKNGKVIHLISKKKDSIYWDSDMIPYVPKDFDLYNSKGYSKYNSNYSSFDYILNFDELMQNLDKSKLIYDYMTYDFDPLIEDKRQLILEAWTEIQCQEFLFFYRR